MLPATAFYFFRLGILIFCRQPPGGLFALAAGLSDTVLACFTTTLPFLPKTAPPFELPQAGWICCSTDLRPEALRFLFYATALSISLPGCRRKREPIKHRERIIPLPFPSTPAKVIRHKPVDGILTTRKDKHGTFSSFNQPPIRPFPAPPSAIHSASTRRRHAHRRFSPANFYLTGSSIAPINSNQHE